MAVYEYDETQQIIDHGHLGRIASAKFEAQAFLDMHAQDYLATPANGQKISAYIEQNGLALTAESMEKAYAALKQKGEILPPKETVARMSADELKQFVKEHGEPITDSWGRTNYELPAAYTSPASSEGFVRPRQGTSLQPVVDQFPEDKNRSFTKKQIAAFSADRFKAYMQRTEQWGR